MNIMKKHNILIITEVFDLMAGSERNITQLLERIDKSRFQLHVASIITGKLAHDMRELGHSVVELHRGGIYTIKGLRNVLFLRNLIREKNISLIVTYHEASDFYGLLLAKMCKIPTISSRRDMGFKTKLHHQIAYKLVGRFIDAEITVCQAVKEEIIRRGWFPAQRIFPIYNGVDLREYGRATRDIGLVKQSIGIRADHPVVGLIANLRRIKGIEYFIKAASIICKRNAAVEFVIVGNGLPFPGCTIQEYQQLAEELGVQQNVHFLGVRQDVSDLIASFDVAVLASLSEGFSNTILEYMASSKPVVATTVGGNSEAVLDGKTGFLVPPGDAESLAKAILSILENKEMALRFGAEGRKRVEKEFSVEKMVSRHEQLFETVIVSKSNTQTVRHKVKNTTAYPSAADHDSV